MTTETVYDIVVIGGGLLGAAVARDAAQRGLSVILFEKDDFGAAAAQSPRLALGSLPALTTLDFARVREDVREREILLQAAPHLVRPQSCLIPFYHSGLLAQTRMRASLALSDALGFDPSLNFDPALPFEHLPRVHQILSAADARRRVPGLRTAGLTGAARVWEAVVPNPARLTLETALDARRHGACLRSHTQAEEISGTGSVRWFDHLTGETGHAQASLVIVAAGAGWLNLGPSAVAVPGSAAVRLTKSVTMEVSVQVSAGAGGSDALLFPQEEGPLLFALPNSSRAVLGAFEASYAGDPAAAYVVGTETAALLQTLTAYLPGLAADAVCTAECAVFSSAPSATEIQDFPARGIFGGLLTLSGGTFTTARRLAEEAVDLACRKLGRALSTPPCRTAVTAFTPLPDFAALPLAAVAEYAVAEEECRTLRDFLLRRLPPSFSAESVFPAALETLAARLNWDKDRQVHERKAWDAAQALTQTFRVL